MPDFDTIILLAGEDESRHFGPMLCGHKPNLHVKSVRSLEELRVNQPIFPRARLIGFTTPIIVPELVLDRLGYEAYNFHPGPPEYPGWAPARAAIRDHAAEFGATAHRMTAKVDAGPIVGVKRFRIPAGLDVYRLEQAAYLQLSQLLWQLSGPLTSREPLPELPVQWACSII